MENIELVEENLVSEEERVENPDAVENEELEIEESIKENNMAEDHRTMVDYAQLTLNNTGSCIVRQAIEANNFEFKASTMTMIYNRCQFEGLLDEDPHAHIQMFLDICATVKQNGVSDDAFKLQLFPFTLGRKARE